MHEKSRSDQYLTSLNEYKEEAKTNQVQSQFQEKAIVEHSTSKAKITEQVKELEVQSRAKIAERNEALKAIEFQLTEEMKMTEQKYRTALSEKREVEIQLRKYVEATKPKHQILDNQCESLKNVINLLLVTGKDKEEHIRVLVTELTKELLELQKSFDQRETELISDCQKLAEERKAAETAINGAYSALEKLVAPEGLSNVYEAQKKDLELTTEQLKIKTEELTELQEKEAEGFKGSRKQLSDRSEERRVGKEC